MLIRRVIHITADFFGYADTLALPGHVMLELMEALGGGCDVVTDAAMAMAVISKRMLTEFGGTAHCGRGRGREGGSGTRPARLRPWRRLRG